MSIHNVNELLAKVDYRLSSNAFSRAQYQVKLICEKLSFLAEKI